MNKNRLLAVSAGLIIVITMALGGVTLFGRSTPPRTPAATPAALAKATLAPSPTAQALAALVADTATPLPPTDTPAPPPSATPSPLPPTATATSTAVPPTAPPAQASKNGNTKQAQAKPTAAPKKDPNLLPNGVRYGDHYPKLPDRVVRIASPNIKLDCKVYEVYAVKGAWEVADYAAGHNYNAANPGEGGNIVISGHNNWRGEVFRYLEFLKPGDEIDVWTLNGKEYKYKVENIEKLKEAGATMAERIAHGHVMDPTPFEQLTLITCWPYTTYTHRLIVTAKPMQ